MASKAQVQKLSFERYFNLHMTTSLRRKTMIGKVLMKTMSLLEKFEGFYCVPSTSKEVF